MIKLLALSVAGLLAASLAACGGQTTDDSSLQVSDADQTSAALASPDPGTGGAGTSDTNDGEDDDDGEHDGDHHGKGDHHEGGKDRCNERDHDQHKHHRHHKFKVLDRIDGAKDGVITIASLPAALPERLIKRLHAIDTNADGLVTKDEVKAWKQAHGD